MTSASHRVPARQLAGFYFAYYAVVGAIVPFLPVYLQWRGFRPGEIGVALAAMAAVRVIAPNLWGWWADRSGRRLLIIRATTAAALGIFVLLTQVQGLVALCAMLGLFSLFWNASLPQLEAVTLGHLQGSLGRYGRIRAGGSIGFVAAVMGLGALIDRAGESVIPAWIFAMLAGTLLASLVIHDAPKLEESALAQSFRQILRRREVWILLTITVLVQVSHGPYYAFFSLYMEQSGYSRLATGALWSFGVICEIGLFLFAPGVWQRWPLVRLLQVALVATVIRWILTVIAPGHLLILVSAQALHLASFAIVHTVTVQLVHQLFPARLHGQGQALISSLGYGLGGAMGAFIAGQLWETSGPVSMFVFATIVASVALIIALVGLKEAQLRTKAA